MLLVLRYLWAGPTTAFGLVFAVAAVLTGGRVLARRGVLEVHGGIVRWLLTRAVPLAGGAEAMTLGHVVLGRTPQGLAGCRAHERVHVRQCEQWGPAFVPAYILASCWAALRGGHAYADNWFERQARDGAGDANA